MRESQAFSSDTFTAMEDATKPTAMPPDKLVTAEQTKAGTVLRPRHGFVKGTSGNPAGRQPGPNKVTVEAKAAANALVDDPDYRRKLRERLIAGTAPHMEPLLWAYAKGKPVDRVETGGPGAFATLDDEELRARLTAALDAIGKAG
jgi:hypothetical protein